MIVQNYPVVSKNPEMNQLLKRIARNKRVPFVDNYRSFQQLWKSGEKRENYFSSDDSHCNARGYGVIAGNVMQIIIEEELLPQ